MIEIDGSQGEGGGQILRSSLSLSVITQQPITISNIRANRKKPGLRPQHLACVQALAQLSEAIVTGDEVGSSHITFSPTALNHGAFHYDIGTAGSTSLLLHALYYPMLWGRQGGTIDLIGGTHNSMAPSFDYLERVWQPLLDLAGFPTTLALESYGFYPKGGGQIMASVPTFEGFEKSNSQPPGFDWTARPEIESIEVVGMFGQPDGHRQRKNIPERMASMAQKMLTRKGYNATAEAVHVSSASTAAVCSIFVTYGPLRAGFVGFGARGVSSEAVGKQVAQEALAFLESDACIDPHAADQLLLPLALRGSKATFTTSELTGHLETNADIVQRFLPNVSIQLEEKEPNLVQVEILPIEPHLP